MADEISKPHDHLFRSAFGEEQESEAARMLQAYLPQAVSRELLWSSLKWQSRPSSTTAARQRIGSAVRGPARPTATGVAVRAHQSTPDRWAIAAAGTASESGTDRRRPTAARSCRWFCRAGGSGPASWPVCRGGARLAGSAALRASADRPDAGRAGRVARRPARSHRALAMMAPTGRAGPVALLAELAEAGRRPGADRGVHCNHDAAAGALAPIRGRGPASGREVET